MDKIETWMVDCYISGTEELYCDSVKGSPCSWEGHSEELKTKRTVMFATLK